eukprot:1042349-Pyramimonas_sp.AAC.1
MFASPPLRSHRRSLHYSSSLRPIVPSIASRACVAGACAQPFGFMAAAAASLADRLRRFFQH